MHRTYIMAGVAVEPHGDLGRSHGDDIGLRVENCANNRAISTTIVLDIEFIGGSLVKYSIG